MAGAFFVNEMGSEIDRNPRLQVAQRLLQRTRDMLGVEATEAEDQDNYVLAVWQFLVFDNEEIISEMFGHGF